MGFINWLLAKPPVAPPAPAAGLARSGLVRTSRPGGPGSVPGAPVPVQNAPIPPRAALTEQQQQRRIERNARRDDLFQVVRESMVRAGVMSSTYKFKVLPLDQQGKAFLVMIDLAAEYGGETQKLNEVEALITRGAKNRHSIGVQGVYWRFYEPEKVREDRVAANTGPAPLFDLGANLRASPNQRPTPVAADANDMRARSVAPDPTYMRAPPVAPDPSSAATRAAKAAVPLTASMAAIHNKLLLTGYEATEMVDPDEPGAALSPTQYGDAR